jgi:adenosylcobalamin-dependent ribonucleoside-diphosphate reductase
VWFNVGAVKNPQSSACFILPVEDDMGSILDLARTEAMIFKGGSGTGTNLSTLRGKNEKLSGGGTASGPLSFMKGFDAFTGAVKSGGRTRRAAKLVILNIDHPDILDFIQCKSREEKKARALIAAGYDSSMDGEAYATVAFQNSNNSVRISDEFMKAEERGDIWETKARTTGEVMSTHQARDLLMEIAKSTHQCGDPGVQFDTTINRYNTCKNSGNINAANACGELQFLDDSACNLAAINLLRFVSNTGAFNVAAFEHVVDLFITAQDILVDMSSYPTPKIEENSKKFRPLGIGYTNLGAMLMAMGLPYDSDNGRQTAAAITALMTGRAYRQSANLAELRGPFAEYEKNAEPMQEVIDLHTKALYETRYKANDSDVMISAKKNWHEAKTRSKRYGFRNAQVSLLAPTGTTSFVLNCFVGETMVAVADGRNAVSFQQLAAEGKDVEVYASENGRTVIRTMRNPRLIRRRDPVVKVLLDDGSSVRCTGDHRFLLKDGTYVEAGKLQTGTSLMRFDSVVNGKTGKLRRTIWMGPNAGGNRSRGHSWHCQYRLTGSRLFPQYNGCSGGLIHHNNNDSLDDTYDNLRLCANIGEHQQAHWAMKSPEERSRIASKRQESRSPEDHRASSRKAHEAQTPDQRKVRAAKAVARHTTDERSEWTRKGWETRRRHGGNHKVVSVTLDGIEDVYCGEVDDTHNFAIITSNAVDSRLDDLSGVVVHNCDTTGIEPDFSLVKTKSLVGGSVMKIHNAAVPRALKRLGYSDEESEEIVAYILENGSPEGMPLLAKEHLPVFDCAAKPANGSRYIAPMGHVKMCAAVQPFLSGATSKTVNVPKDATPEDIADLYIQAWKLGVKTITVYRDGSKSAQPLQTKEAKPETATQSTAPAPKRHRLPEERVSVTHKFSIVGHEGYVTVGQYEDGTPGEMFIRMSKAGSVISGLMDGFALSISLALQYGVPLEVLVDKYTHTRFEPSGFTTNKNIPMTTSILDYIFRWMGAKYLTDDQPIPDMPQPVQQRLSDIGYLGKSNDSEMDGPPCPRCGSIMVRSGTCHTCRSCGTSGGCG